MKNDKYLDIAMDLKEKYNIKCYKKNKSDKLYSFILDFIDYSIKDDLEVDRFICQKYRFTIKELRLVKRYLRLYCNLVEIEEEI